MNKMKEKTLHIETIDQPDRYSKRTLCGKWVRIDDIAKRADDSNCPKCQKQWKAYQELDI